MTKRLNIFALLISVVIFNSLAKSLLPTAMSNYLTHCNDLPQVQSENTLDSLLTTIKAEEIPSLIKEAQRTLWDTTSPSFNEQLMLRLLLALHSRNDLNDESSIRVDALLSIASKNRIGTKAANIEWITPEGANGDLYSISAEMTLIYFNDPECMACQTVKERLDTCSTLRTMVQQQRLAIVAINPYLDTRLWQQEPYPDYIINGHDFTQAINDEELYYLPSLPVFYLLDKNKIIVAKNEPSLNRILNIIKNN